MNEETRSKARFYGITSSTKSMVAMNDDRLVALFGNLSDKEKLDLIKSWVDGWLSVNAPKILEKLAEK